MAGLTCLVLGAGAGGGSPQWNCNCAICARVRAGDPAAPPRSQIQLAATADGERYLLIGASPDLRQQILATQALHPRLGTRHSPIAGIVLTSADVDGLAGLLVLREQSPFTVFAAPPVLDILAQNRIFDVLDPGLVRRQPIAPGEPVEPWPGLRLTLLTMPGKVPLYHEDRTAEAAEAASTYAARVEAAGRRLTIAPACARITQPVLDALAGTHTLLFDGTVYHDDEMKQAGTGTKTGRRMGHLPIAGEDGSLARLANLPGRRIFVHINNTNPILLANSPERRAVEQAGWEVAHDGMEIIA